MINLKDIKLIEEKIDKIKKNNLSDFLEINIDELRFDNIKEISDDFIFIDSSYTSNIIGPYYYIFAKAVGVNKDGIKSAEDFILIPSSFIKYKKSDNQQYMSIRDFASLFSKNLEYIVASEYENIVIDGSIISDSLYYINYDYFEDEEINNKLKSFKENFEKAIKNKRIFSIAKRILESFIINKNIRDFDLLLNKFPEKDFYTKIYRKNLLEILNNQNIKDIYKILDIDLKIVFFRARPLDHIYRLETIDKIDDEYITSFIYKYIYKDKSYPKFLKTAHYLCKIRKEDSETIEKIIRKKLGYNITAPIETK